MNPEVRELLRRQLDQQLKLFRRLAVTRPARGWVRTIRDAIGMNGRQLADRMGIARSQLSQIENAEVRSSTTLRTLERAAAALGCEFVYAFVPQGGATLEEVVHDRAREVAEGTVERVSHTMALEEQGIDGTFRKREVDRLAGELVRTMRREFWDGE